MARPGCNAELVLGLGQRCGRKRVERLMAQAHISGIHRRKKNRGCIRTNPDATPSEDLVNRDFKPTQPDRLWVMDVTEHPTGENKVYLAVVLDAFSRRVVGWSIADHIRSELVVDALQMAIWRRRPPAGQTVAHSDHGSTYTSWAFGRRLRAAGLLGSMGPSATAPPLRRAPLGDPPSAGPGDLRMARGLVQPGAPALLLPHAQPRRLRSHPRSTGRIGGMSSTGPENRPSDALRGPQPMRVV